MPSKVIENGYHRNQAVKIMLCAPLSYPNLEKKKHQKPFKLSVLLSLTMNSKLRLQCSF